MGSRVREERELGRGNIFVMAQNFPEVTEDTKSHIPKVKVGKN